MNGRSVGSQMATQRKIHEDNNYNRHNNRQDLHSISGMQSSAYLAQDEAMKKGYCDQEPVNEGYYEVLMDVYG